MAGLSLAAMGVASMLDLIAAAGAEQVAMASDDRTGLRAIVAIHSTTLGPSLGGARFRPYRSEHEALVDVLRLARGMTYKHALAGNDLGGGKAVLIEGPAEVDRGRLMASFGRLVDRLGGRYLTAEDVGTTRADMDVIRTVTPHVTGVSEKFGGSGDPSPATAWGVLQAMHAVAERQWDDPSLQGRHVVVAGVGKVGLALAAHLAAHGARVTVADVRPEAAHAAAALGAEVVDPQRAHAVPCDVFAPCALGATLNDQTIPQLACQAVCGAANNQLSTADDGARLAARGILYAPDYVVNAGGVINIADELKGYDHDRAYARIESIRATLSRVFAWADEHAVTPAEAADRLAEQRLAAARRLGPRAESGPPNSSPGFSPGSSPGSSRRA